MKNLYLSQAISSKKYDNLCIVLKALRYIAKGSPASSNGFPKFLSFGLPKKMSLNIIVEPPIQGGTTLEPYYLVHF